ncbi:MAG: hypothetical protein GXO75_05890 [Calditrichaeota bacterium]|nr:hypothetical protein [Calditrichota bacterium]
MKAQMFFIFPSVPICRLGRKILEKLRFFIAKQSFPSYSIPKPEFGNEVNNGKRGFRIIACVVCADSYGISDKLCDLGITIIGRG